VSFDDDGIVDRCFEESPEVVGIVAAVCFDLQLDLLAAEFADPPHLD